MACLGSRPGQRSRLARLAAGALFAPQNGGEQPDVGFLPALQRRRLSRLARMAFYVAWPLADAAGPLPLVFASRHGETPRTLAILSDLAHDDRSRPPSSASRYTTRSSACGRSSVATPTK